MKNLFLIYETYTNGYRTEILDIISLFAILCGILVIISKNPVVSVLFLIGLFAGISCYLIMLGLSFIGLSYLIVYIGAVNKSMKYAALVQIQLYKVFLILIKFYEWIVFTYPSSSFNTKISLIPYHNYCSSVKVKSGIKNENFYSTLACTDLDYENFLKWFVGFSDGESNFTIVFQKDKNGIITGASFRFILELHIDDINTLKYIKSKLNIGSNISEYGNSCKFRVMHKKDIEKLISIFDKYNLNTTKYLDYLDFKKAFQLYQNSTNNKKILIDKLVEIKNGMNVNRKDFTYPSDHKIVVSSYWLLGLIEGEGSFYLDRHKFQPSFMLSLTEVQYPVIEKIYEFLVNNLGFDKYSIFKLQNSSVITIIKEKSKDNSKSLVKLKITNTNVIINYFIPFLNTMSFITKKGLDFQDFKIISTAIYNGGHRNKEVKDCILTLSYTMNNYRLSTNSESVKVLELPVGLLDKIINVTKTIVHLSDGRPVDIFTKKEINIRWTNCVYEIIKNNGEIKLASTLNNAGLILDVDHRTVRKYLNSLSTEGDFAIIKDNKIRRVAVFYN
jgi:hypothetical protein